MARVSSAALAKRELSAFGYTHLAPDLLDPAGSGCTERQVADFVGSWNSLPRDPYLVSSNGASRLRRYGRISLYDDGIRLLPPAPFVQSNDVNPIFGGIERRFAELEPSVVTSPVLERLIRLLCQCLPQWSSPNLTRDNPSVDVGIHQIRVQASASAAGLPTPEGIHQDGHRFVAQVFIVRNAINGGRSSFYEDGTVVYDTYLTQPFECLLVDDRRLHHGVSAIEPVGATAGWRDMLLLDFPEVPSVETVGSTHGAEAAWSLQPSDALGG